MRKIKLGENFRHDVINYSIQGIEIQITMSYAVLHEVLPFFLFYALMISLNYVNGLNKNKDIIIFFTQIRTQRFSVIPVQHHKLFYILLILELL